MPTAWPCECGEVAFAIFETEDVGFPLVIENGVLRRLVRAWHRWRGYHIDPVTGDRVAVARA